MRTIDSDETFVCPECHGKFPVDRGKKRALIRHGCAVCGASVTDKTVDEGPGSWFFGSESA